MNCKVVVFHHQCAVADEMDRQVATGGLDHITLGILIGKNGPIGENQKRGQQAACTEIEWLNANSHK
jgi:hypothetical protein